MKSVFNCETKETIIREFTQEELDQKALDDANYQIYLDSTKDERNKQKARERISTEVGDIYELVDMVTRRLAILERYVIFTLPFLVSEDIASIPSFIGSEFTPMIETLQSNFIDGLVVDEIDLEDSVQVMQDIMTKQTKKSGIIKTEYLDKKGV